MDESDGTSDSVLQHKPIWATYNPKWKKEKKRTVEKKKQGDLHGTYGTKVFQVWAQQSIISCLLSIAYNCCIDATSLSLWYLTLPFDTK